MNKDEFQKNRQIFRMLSSDMFNQMNNMYDQLAIAEQRIEKARKEGFERGVEENLEDCFDNYLRCDESVLSESALAMREKFEEALNKVAMKKNWWGNAIPISWLIEYKDRYAVTSSKDYDAVAAEVLVDLLADWEEEKPLKKAREQGYRQAKEMYGADDVNTTFTDEDAHFGEVVLWVIKDLDLPMLMCNGEKEAVRKALIKALDERAERKEE